MEEHLRIPDVNLQLVHELLKRGVYAEALILIRRALIEHPDEAELHFLLGGCLYRVKAYEEAREALEKAVELAPAHADAQRLLQKVQDHVKGKGEKSPATWTPDSTSWFNVDEAAIAKQFSKHTLKKKTCPTCGREIMKSNWRCPLCGHRFFVRIAIGLSILILTITAVLYGMGFAYRWLTGTLPAPVKVVNLVGVNGASIQFLETEWLCHGVGIRRVGRGEGYYSYVEGQIRNGGTRPIEKLNFTIHFLGSMESTFVWMDVFSLPPGGTVRFSFPDVLPPAKARQCEIHLNEVAFADADKALEPLQFFVPASDHFPSYRIEDERGAVLAEKNAPNIYQSGMLTREKESSFWLDYLRAFVISYLSLVGAAFLVNYCIPGLAWNHEWKSDLAAAFLIILGITFLNVWSALIGYYFAFRAILRFAQIGLVFLLFQRSIGQTILLIVFYLCLNSFFVGAIQRFLG